MTAQYEAYGSNPNETKANSSTNTTQPTDNNESSSEPSSTVTNEDKSSNKQDSTQNNKDNKKNDKNAIYSISVEPSIKVDFKTVVENKYKQMPYYVKVTNTGNKPTGAINISLTGSGASNFELNKTQIPVWWLVKPVHL